MNTAMTTYSPADGIDVITTAFPIPGMGEIPINAFVLHGAAPILVDTGPTVLADEFMAALRSVIDPGDLRWLFLTHTDFDHTGSIGRLLDECPDLKVVTTFIGVGIMSLHHPLPMDRVHLLNPGQQLSLPDRSLTAFRPPVFDNPSTTGFYDDLTGALVTSDCFGAVLAGVPERASELSSDELCGGQVLWATVDSPWLHDVDEAKFRRNLDRLGDFEADVVLSSHLPAAGGDMLDTMVAALAQAPSADRFVGPDQVMLEAMLAAMPA